MGHSYSHLTAELIALCEASKFAFEKGDIHNEVESDSQMTMEKTQNSCKGIFQDRLSMVVIHLYMSLCDRTSVYFSFSECQLYDPSSYWFC